MLSPHLALFSGLGLGLGPEVFLPVGLRGMTLLVCRTWVSVQQTPLPWALALCCPPHARHPSGGWGARRSGRVWGGL